MDLTFLHDQIVNQRGHNIRLVLHSHRDLPDLSFNFIRRCHLPQQSCLHFAFACISLCLSVFSHRGKLLFSLVTASFVPVNIPLRSILTMQHILGRKSFIVNPKSMMVLSNTGTMHFIIWGFVAVKGSRQMYLFPAITSDLSSAFSCCQHNVYSYASYTNAGHFMKSISIHSKNRSLHHESCRKLCYLVLFFGWATFNFTKIRYTVCSRWAQDRSGFDV